MARSVESFVAPGRLTTTLSMVTAQRAVVLAGADAGADPAADGDTAAAGDCVGAATGGALVGVAVAEAATLESGRAESTPALFDLAHDTHTAHAAKPTAKGSGILDTRRI
jgi:hypothetical protein